MLDSASLVVESVCSEEEDALENIPENLQESDRYANIECVIDYLEDAIEDIASAKNGIESAIG